MMGDLMEGGTTLSQDKLRLFGVYMCCLGPIESMNQLVDQTSNIQEEFCSAVFDKR